MANQTGMQGTQASTGAGRMQGGATGVADPVYNLISIVYHALQGADLYRKYEQDAQGDQQLAQFFRQACEDEKRRAQQGRELLLQCLQSGGGHGQQLQSGSAGQQRSGSTGGQQSQSGASGQQGGMSSPSQQSQSGSRSSQMGGSSSPSSQQSQSGSSVRSSQQSQSGSSGSSRQHGSGGSDRSNR
jgi:hypothetical protein